MKDRGGVAGDAENRALRGDDSIASPLEFRSTPVPLTTMRSAEEAVKTRAWNTKNLPLRLGTDAIAAATAGFLIAPIITIIDR
jgi:hypothetical protein